MRWYIDWSTYILKVDSSDRQFLSHNFYHLSRKNQDVHRYKADAKNYEKLYLDSLRVLHEQAKIKPISYQTLCNVNCS